MSTMSVREQILVLARRHGIAMGAPDEQEEMAAAISRLSDNDIREDEARLALVRLRRAKIITTEQGHDWLLRLLEEDENLTNGAST